MVLKTHMNMSVAKVDFLEKFCLPPKFGKLSKYGPKTGLFNFLKTSTFTEFAL